MKWPCPIAVLSFSVLLGIRHGAVINLRSSKISAQADSVLNKTTEISFSKLDVQSMHPINRGSFLYHDTLSGSKIKKQSLALGDTASPFSNALLACVCVAMSSAALACIVYMSDRDAFKSESIADSALRSVSLIHLFSVLSSGVMVPASYQFMLRLEASASFSGLYVGIYNFCWGIIANFFVWLLLQKFPHLWQTGSNWLLWVGVAMQFLGISMYNSILLALDSHSPPSSSLRFQAVFSRALMGTGAGIVSYVWRYLIAHLVPAEKRPKANMLIPFVNMIGNGLGPLALAVAHIGGYIAPSRSSSAHVFIRDGAPLFLFMFLNCYLAGQFPSLAEVREQKSVVGHSRRDAKAKARSPPSLPLSQKALLLACVAFSTLWGVSFGGLEVAMVQILTGEFSLTISLACVLIASTILAVVPLKLMFNPQRFDIKSWINLLMGMASVGATMLLDVSKLSSSIVVQIGLLLIADILIFPAFSLSWGLCDGIALEHAPDEGWFGSSTIIMASQTGFAIARLAGAMLSRHVVTEGGRNMYALQQISTTLIAWLIAAGLILPNTYDDLSMQSSGQPFMQQWSKQSSLDY